ncbi:hypothetical protein SteCoe_28327 [Stentor coeruleus]|uniref:Sugar transporter SWEET1 n=1 Tax=Stentor coeruleus TaxID=5963 RepID=A0A1R2B8R5_9CILI|nr:hypothetical protein SteCoe_28327 [Stentor coeruleus]
MEAEIVLSSIGIILSVINTVTPTIAIYHRAKSQSLHQVPLNFLCLYHACQLSCLIYSIMIVSPSLIIINIITTFLSCINLLLYVMYTGKIEAFLPKYFVSFIMSSFLTMNFASYKFVGSMSSVLKILSSISSLESIKEALKTKDFKVIDIGMAFSGFLASAVWAMFGKITMDVYVYFSSMVGVVICLTLTVVYYYLKFTKKANN